MREFFETWWSLEPLAQLLVPITLLCVRLPKRPHYVLRSMAVLAVLLGIAVVPLATGVVTGLDTMQAFVVFSVLLAVFVLLVLFVYDVRPWTAIFCATAGYTLQNIASGLEILIQLVVTHSASAQLDGAWDAIVSIGVPTVVYAAGYWLLVRRVNVKGLLEVENRMMLSMLVVVVIVVIGFDVIIKALVFKGIPFNLLVLLRPALLPLVLLLPTAVWIFRRTLREATAACAGLLLPLAAWCYVNWGAGGTLSAPLLHIGTDFASGTPLTLFLRTPLYELIPAGCMLLFGLFSALHVLSEFYTTGMKPRFIFIFNMTALLLTTLLLGGPDAARNDACLIAVPASLLIPFSFVRINRAIVWPLYLLLAASAVISSILQ